jgi:hypothetical protein
MAEVEAAGHVLFDEEDVVVFLAMAGAAQTTPRRAHRRVGLAVVDIIVLEHTARGEADSAIIVNTAARRRK